MFPKEYFWDGMTAVILLLVCAKVWDLKAKGLNNLGKTAISLALLGGGLLLSAAWHHRWFFSVKEESDDMVTGLRSFHWPSIVQVIFAVAIMVFFYFLFKKAKDPKEWSAEKDENGVVIKAPAVRWVSVISCVIVGVCLGLVICWPKVLYLWVILMIGLALDLLYITPYLHVYAVLWFQRPVQFWHSGLHIFLPSWLPKNIFDIWNLSRERIEATNPTDQLPTADTPVSLSGEKDDTFSATISLVSWMVFWTNWWPEKFIRYSRTDRDQLKTIVFNIVEAFEAEILLGLTFEQARQKQDHFLTNVDLQHEAENLRRLPEFRRLEQEKASDSDWWSFAADLFPEDERGDAQLAAYGRFLELRSRILNLVGCLLEDIRIKDRNADPAVEEALNAVTLTRLELQRALISIEKADAEGQAQSKRESEALKGVLEFIQTGNNAAALAVWTDFQRATHNQNVNIGGVDIGAVLAQLAKAVVPKHP